MSIVITFFFKRFVQAFFLGLILRMIIAIVFRENDVSFWGFFNSGWVCGAFYCIITYMFLAGF